MCKIGDILLIYNARDRVSVGVHPFVVLDDTAGVVRGVYGYDFIGLLMSSADTDTKIEKLKQFEGNFPISPDDKNLGGQWQERNKAAYLKADQFFYFDKNKIKYLKIGTLSPEIFDLVIEFIEELAEKGVRFRQIIDKSTRID